MQLSAIELPTSYYAVSKQYGNSFFTITVDTAAPIVINIPDGNYETDTIIKIINKQLENEGAPYNKVNFLANLTVSSPSPTPASIITGFIGRN